MKPNLPVLGPKLGKELGDVRAALEAGDFEQLDGGSVPRRPATSSSRRRCSSSDAARRAGRWPRRTSITVALDTRLDPELELEGRVLDLIHHVNTLRKQEGYELTDRIVLTLPQSHADVLAHEDWIKRETLAVEINVDSVESPQIAKA